LLDEQQRSPLRAQLAQRVRDAVDRERREPQRRLVEQQHGRVAHQRTSAAGPLATTSPASSTLTSSESAKTNRAGARSGSR
jgi:hypothetical protein